jgi:hypothetical protein
VSVKFLPSMADVRTALPSGPSLIARTGIDDQLTNL